MSTLTGQAIKDTYDGLLKLTDSTTGITSTPQQIQDGLGNNTGTRIATNFFSNPNVFPMQNQSRWIPDYMGPGFTSATSAPIANTQNKLNCYMFYDSGIYNYSGITYVCGTSTTTSDVVDLAFYTVQYMDGTGYVPYELIMSGISLTTTTGGGFVTTNFPSTLSFSAYGGGYFYVVYKISNAGVTPTVRYNDIILTGVQPQQMVPYHLGWTKNRSANQLVAGIGSNAFTFPYIMNGATSFKTTFTTTDGDINTSVNPYRIGFGLKCIK